MKTELHYTRYTPRLALLLALLSTLNLQPSTLFAQGTAFTYQGRLNDGVNPAAGIYDLRFTIYDSTNNPGVVIAGPITNSTTGVSNGFFTVALDFGNGPFTNGAPRWLEIGVRTNGGGAFAALTPRQQLTPTPYAIYAEGASAAGLNGTIPSLNLGGTYGNAVNFNNGANDFDGTFTGQFFGSIFTGGLFTGTFLGSGSGLGDVWHTVGNLGTTPAVNFLGTTDNQPLEIRVNNQRVLRLEPATDIVGFIPNVIGGHKDNYVVPGITAAFIGGGGGPGLSNTIASTESVIAGGHLNHIEAGNAYDSVIGGGFDNTIGQFSALSIIAGGHAHRIGTNSPGSIIGGGNVNNIQTNVVLGTIGGGGYNTILSGASWSTIAGGYGHTEGDINTFIGGGWANTIAAEGGQYSVIGGGEHNQIEGLADHSVIGGGAFNVITGAFNFAVVATIAGGYANKVQTNSGVPTIGGGAFNTIRGGNYNTIAGGVSHLAGNTNGSFVTVGGGSFNNAEGNYSTVPGGRQNWAFGQYSFAAGRQAKATNDGAFVWADSTGGDFYSGAPNQFVVRASGGFYFHHGPAGVDLDQFNLNNGDLDYGLKFGLGSGEGIASKRTGGGNQYGLDFYTQFNPRMSIAQNGNVGIGTNLPAAVLHVVGTNLDSEAVRIVNGGLTVTGLIRSGAETNTSEAPFPAGLVVRRINSTSSAANQVVARTDSLTLERDGSSSGLLVRYPASPGRVTINVLGVNNTGAFVSKHYTLNNPIIAGTLQLFVAVERVAHAQISFGRTYDAGQHMTQVVLDRYDDGPTDDFYWTGTLTSTFNQ